jgi:hypothetical protein
MNEGRMFEIRTIFLKNTLDVNFQSILIKFIILSFTLLKNFYFYLH